MTSYEYDYNDLIVVLVGKWEHQFQVHRDIIRERSKFFEAAVSDDRWVEGQERLVRLPEIAPQAFSTYTHWIYRDQMSIHVFWQEDHPNIWREQQAYYEIYMLAEYLDDARLRVHILDVIISKSLHWRKVPGFKFCDVIWDRTPKGSPLRTFVIDWKAQRESRSKFAKDVEEYPKEFLEEMAVYLMRHRTRKSESAQAFAARIRAKLLPERS